MTKPRNSGTVELRGIKTSKKDFLENLYQYNNYDFETIRGGKGWVQLIWAGIEI
jgi:hypothetical protein